MKHIRVVAGVLFRENKFLIACRQEGTHLADYWEFPGGKTEPNESDEEALIRELDEELGISCEVGELLNEVKHDYPEKSVHLLFYHIKSFTGEPKALIHADLAWITTGEIENYKFPPADEPVLNVIRGLLN